MEQFSPVSHAPERILATNKVIKNTYILLSATLVFSAVMAAVSMAINPPHGLAMIAFFGSMIAGMFVLPRMANSSAGIIAIFAIVGALGFGIGPMLNQFMGLANGGQLIATALGGTGIMFLGLSGYALTTRRDFSFMGGFVAVGFLVIISAIILNLFMSIPALSLAISAGIILLSSAAILFQTSLIINGGETNYIMATYSLFVSFFNIFINLLSLLGAFGGDD